MLILLSPAKIQNFIAPAPTAEYSIPVYLKEAEKLIQELKSYSIRELTSLMQVNVKIAEQNAERFFNWHRPFTPDNAKQALWVYNGEVFHGLDAGSMKDSEIGFAQQHLRILSGLYGILRPLDLIQAYRLDVSHKLGPTFGADLYEFWRDKITTEVKKALRQSGEPKLVFNLMSGEYTKAIDPVKLKARIIDFEFLQYQPDTERFKPITIYIKKARGLMARYIIRNAVTSTEALKAFADEGYWYNEQLSTVDKFVFVR